MQLAGALSAQIEKDGDEETTKIVFRRGVSEDAEKDLRYLKGALGVAAAVDELPVVAGAFRRDANEIALLTNSMQSIFRTLSDGVQVPAQDLSDGRATPFQYVAADEEGRNLATVQIRSSVDRPSDAYAAARYRDHWFWIDDRDLASKRMFMFLMIFSSLAETGVAVETPLVVRSTR
jgi:hypothetical protein